MGPKEDPQAKTDRMRERRLSLLDRRETSEQAAGRLTTDLRTVYGMKGLSLFNMRGTSVAPPATKAAPRTSPNR